MSDGPGYVVRIERTFAAPAEAVFDAWTSAEVMRRWFHAGPDWDTPEAEVDLRVGGAVRIVMRRPDGTRAAAHGEYRVIDRPRRLVMVWTFDDIPSNTQLIELTFSESEGATTVRMVNSGIVNERARRGSASSSAGGSASTSSSGCSPADPTRWGDRIRVSRRPSPRVAERSPLTGSDREKLPDLPADRWRVGPFPDPARRPGGTGPCRPVIAQPKSSIEGSGRGV